MTDLDRDAWTRNTMADLRANGGTPSFGPLKGRPLAIMTSKGAKSGQERTVIVTYHRDGDAYVIAATKGGSSEALATRMREDATTNAKVVADANIKAQ